MANNNVQNVRFLRNGTLFTTRDEAKNALTGFTLTAEMDGSVILARYTDSEANAIKTLMGLVYFKDASNNSITIFDIDDAGSDVDAKILAAVQALDAEETSTDGTNVQVKVTEVDGKITAVNITTDNTVNETDITNAINNLDYTGLTADDNKAVYNVTEADGVVAAQAKNISEFKLAGYEEASSTGNVATTDTIGQAFGKLQKTIHEMDYTDTATTGYYVSKVDEVDGKISATHVALPSVNAISETGKPITAVSESLGAISATAGTINADYVNITDSGEKFTSTTVEDALAELADKATAGKISSSDKTVAITTATTGTDVSVNIDGTTLVKNLSTGVISSDLKIKSIAQAEGSAYASQYQLVYGNSNTPIGDVISVGKDQFLKEASYDASTQTLTLVMYNSTGGTTNIDVDFSAAIIESEAGEGLYVSTGHTLNVGVANDSEAVTTGAGATQAVLVVGEDSIKVQGIQAAIDYKVSTLDATVGSTIVASGKHVAVQVAEADGVLTAVTVTEDDIASKIDLDTLSAKTVTAVEMTGGTAAIAENLTDGTKKITINADGASVKATGYSKGSDASGIEATDSINAALSKLENQVDAAKAAATTKVEKDANASHLTLTSTTGADGSVTYTIGQDDIASETALTAEIAARKAVDGQTGQTYAANTGSSYISGASDLNDADVKLDIALKAADDAMLTGVVAGNGIDITTKANKSQTVSAKVKNDGGIVNDAEGLHLGYIDAGTYDVN